MSVRSADLASGIQRAPFQAVSIRLGIRDSRLRSSNLITDPWNPLALGPSRRNLTSAAWDVKI